MNSEIKIPKWSLWAYIALSLIGFIDAAYVTAKFYLRSPLNCAIFENCNQVITSSYGKIFNIPLSLYGAFFYLTIFLLSVYYVDVKRDWILKAIFFLTVFGFVFSLYLIYVQAFLLNQFCIYCLVSALISIILFLNTAFNWVKFRRGEFNQNE